MDLHQLLGDETEPLLSYECKGVPREDLVLPGPDFIDRVFSLTDRSVPVLRNLGVLLNTGRLGGTGYISILPVDQGIEHTAAASFSPNPIYFDPKNIVELAVDAGCNAVATTLGVLGAVARRYAHRIPFIAKVNHNELLTYPQEYDQVMFGSVQQAFELGAVGVGATVYWGAQESRREMQEVSEAFEEAHQLGMFTVLWCYVRNSAFKKDGVNYETSADLTGQANHLGVTIHADIIKQKLPENNGGFPAIGFGPRPSSSTATTRPTTRSTSPAGRSSTTTWAAYRSSTAVGRPRAPATWLRPCAPPSSTSGPGEPGSSWAARPSSVP